MTVRAGNRVPIYGPIYEAHDFCKVGPIEASGLSCDLPIFKR
jgi:hypothetical protein